MPKPTPRRGGATVEEIAALIGQLSPEDRERLLTMPPLAGNVYTPKQLCEAVAFVLDKAKEKRGELARRAESGEETAAVMKELLQDLIPEYKRLHAKLSRTAAANVEDVLKIMRISSEKKITLREAAESIGWTYQCFKNQRRRYTNSGVLQPMLNGEDEEE